jgi:2'-5' RNA ligase
VSVARGHSTSSTTRGDPIGRAFELRQLETDIAVFSMRLFLAADLSDATRAAIDEVASQIRLALPEGRTAPRLVWIAPDAAHVTLRFIGEVDEATLAAVASVLSTATLTPPFDVTWQPIGTFPPGRRPRVVWLGPTGGRDELVTLAVRVDGLLHRVIGSREGRPFAPHVTLARVKDAGPGIDWPRLLADVRSPATVTRVDHVTLYQSHLGPKGSTYTVRIRTRLQ